MIVEVLHLLKLIIGLFLMVTIDVVLLLQTIKMLYDMKSEKRCKDGINIL